MQVSFWPPSLQRGLRFLLLQLNLCFLLFSELRDFLYSAVTMSETDRRFRSFSDLEKDTIGKLLPDNEEDLLAGIGQNADMDRTVHSTGSNGFEEREDFDLFSSGECSNYFVR